MLEKRLKMTFKGILTYLTFIHLATLSTVDAETSVEAYSEGSDCRCKCILTMRDGGPCNGLNGARKTIYLVETISGGTDCRCTCHTPSPSGCEGESNLDDSPVAPSSSVSEANVGSMSDIDLVELHSTISSMVSVMVKLEKAVTKSGSENTKATIQNNVNKVVTALQNTNGSYRGLLRDLNLSSSNETENQKLRGGVTVEKTGDSLVIPPLANTGAAGEGEEESVEKPLRNIGVSPRPPSVAAQTAASTKPESSSTITEEANTSTTPSENVPTETPDLTTTTRKVEVSQTAQSRRTTISTKASVERVVEPRVVYFPYRAKKPHTPRSRPQKTTTTETGDYNYDYDEFDVAVTKQTTTTTTSTTTEPSTTIMQSRRTVLPSVEAVGNTTTKQDSYADYLDEYDYDYDETTTKSTTTTAPASTDGYGPCGTLVSISRPTVISHFGRREGAWMRDPVPSKTDPTRRHKIYVANFYYGSNVMEFEGIEGMRDLRYVNSYNLPHKWIGTGHVVYNGSFYYNRAFSTTLIKYNLRYRFVSAWSRLANAMYEVKRKLSWRGHSMVHMAADEEGLWVIYPSYDPFDPHAKLNYVINKINPVDLRVLGSYKTKLRHPASHAFMICGMLYTTDRYNSRRARVTHAFDTRTLVQRTFYLGFENMFSYASQFLYNPFDRKIYAWDNGRQVQYEVGLMQ